MVGVAGSQPTGDASSPSLATQSLCFSYPGTDGRPMPGIPPVIQDMSIQLQPGSRCLLVGANGAGKTSLLKVLAGKHMVPKGTVEVLGRSPFHDTQLTASGDLSYLGGSWDRDIAFAGYSIPLQGDFPASRMIEGVQGADSARKARLLKVLDIDPKWRMHQVSDGQRRRVQLMLGLLHPFKVLLLDEITVDLDVLGRADLLRFLQQETEERAATVIYATHIFDGLETWPTHLMYVARGRLQLFSAAAHIPEMRDPGLLRLIERWLRKEKEQKLAAKGTGKDISNRPVMESMLPQWNNGFVSGRMTASLKDSSNAVMRM